MEGEKQIALSKMLSIVGNSNELKRKLETEYYGALNTKEIVAVIDDQTEDRLRSEIWEYLGEE